MTLDKILTTVSVFAGGILGLYVGLDYTISKGIFQEGICPTPEELRNGALILTGSVAAGSVVGNYVADKCRDLMEYCRKG